MSAAPGRSDISEEIEGGEEKWAVEWPPRTLIGCIEAVAEGLALLVFIAVIIITLLQVLARYVLQMPLPWTEELARTLFVASMMVGIALAVRRHEHIVVDFLFARLSLRSKAAVSIGFDAAILLLLAVWLRGAILLAGVNAAATYVSLPWLRVAHLYATEAAAIVLMMVFILADIHRQAQRFQTGEGST